MRFKTTTEALAAIDLAKGRSWGGKGISRKLAQPGIHQEKAFNPWSNSSRIAITGSKDTRCEGSTIREESQEMVRVAP